MYEIILAGGWLMLPILLCSVIATAIVIERLVALRQSRVLPPELINQVLTWADRSELDRVHVKEIATQSPLGKIIAIGVQNQTLPRDQIKVAIEDAGRHVVHDMERYLPALGTIAHITPLLGLLGTVIGMITVFDAITTHGVGDPTVLADGISQALITTAAGISVAIPSIIAFRYLRSHINEMIVRMEKQAIHLLDVLERRQGHPFNGETSDPAAHAIASYDVNDEPTA
ncbi:MAG: MotA/TolQ/ExbB proton channel family protein [Gammaproteobacteria bacterium]|nr:MotA/TolQ/ExbB proton channel family protein [Gammaproteobacteria bacterium]MCP5135200.1 MotA/TolQ/ExbB proton channel family protein [Gammaproteobacteria bacterium]